MIALTLRCYAAAERRAGRGQLTGDRRAMTLVKVSLISREPTGPAHNPLRICRLDNDKNIF
jgi:hypothetical protein